jgi:hypothetical protein
MEIARDIFLITHFLGMSMIIGPFLLHLRSRSGYPFSWVFAGSIVQLVTGLILVGLAEMRIADEPDMALDHIKVAVKLGLALVIFVVALLGYLKVRKGLAAEAQRSLMPLFHSAGGLAVVNLAIAVLWPGMVVG